MKSVVDVEITPEMMAQAFWDMDNIQQAKFFDSLAKVVAKDSGSSGSIQWYYLGRHLRENGNQTSAREMLMAMAAPLYLHTLTATGE